MDNIADIKPRVLKIIGKQLHRTITNKMTALKIKNDLGADSLDIANIVTQLEISFHLPIFDDEIDKFSTVDDIVFFLERNTEDNNYFVEDSFA